MQIKIFNIDYDTDGEQISLPETLTMNVLDGSTEDEIYEIAENFISDSTGFCHNGFNIETN